MPGMSWHVLALTCLFLLNLHRVEGRLGSAVVDGHAVAWMSPMSIQLAQIYDARKFCFLGLVTGRPHTEAERNHSQPPARGLVLGSRGNRLAFPRRDVRNWI
jgi:hypothetical protein